MKIIRNSPDTTRGPGEWFTGEVFLEPIVSATSPSRLNSATVHFTPGARTAWHTHPYGQTIHLTEGVGRCQRENGPIEVIHAGDTVYFEPEENHWHGAAPNGFMTHIAMQESDESGSAVNWGRHVTDEEYLGS